MSGIASSTPAPSRRTSLQDLNYDILHILGQYLNRDSLDILNLAKTHPALYSKLRLPLEKCAQRYAMKLPEERFRKAIRTGNKRVVKSFLKMNLNPDVRFPNGDRPVPVAILARQIQIARILKQMGSNISAVNEQTGADALTIAAFLRDEKLVMGLLNLGARVSPPALRAITERCSTRVWRRAVKDVNIRRPLFHSENLLFAAVQNKEWPELIDEVCSRCPYLINGRDEKGNTPLMCAISDGNLPAFTRLLRNGPNLAMENNDGDGALFLALRRGQIQMAKRLIDHTKMPLDCRELTHSKTPLHLALEMGFVELAVQMIDNGADINAWTDTWSTPLHIAAARKDVQRDNWPC